MALAPKPYSSVSDSTQVCPDLLKPSKNVYTIGHEIDRVGQQGTDRLFHSSRLMLYGEECLTQERWHLWEKDSEWGSWLCPSSSLPEALQHSLSLQDSSVL